MNRAFNAVQMTALLVALAATALAADDPDTLLRKMSEFNAVQIVYREGVPHTDSRGRLLTQYDPERSFFQIAIWGNPYGTAYGYDYDLKVLTDSGFNTMWPWPSRSLEDQLETGLKSGLQVVTMQKHDLGAVAAFKDHPAWLGNCWHDEPTGGFWGKDMEGKFAEFLAYKAKMNELVPGVPVFINDVPWVTPPATSWWVKWNTSGDVACHDNYPLLDRKRRARTLGTDPPSTGISETVSLAVAANEERKPVWFIVGAFTSQERGAFPFRMATPVQLRAQVYAALIHGATGIIYFCWDTYVCRDGKVIGMSPDPRVAYLEAGPGKPKASPAKPMQLAQSKALWMAATQINSEIRELTPSLLSPTAPASVRYGVTFKGEPVTSDPLRCILKPHPEGGFVLLTVNLDDAVLDATYRFEDGLAMAAPLFENREALQLSEDSLEFSDVYEPFDVHVYRIMPRRPEGGQ